MEERPGPGGRPAPRGRRTRPLRGRAHVWYRQAKETKCGGTGGNFSIRRRLGAGVHHVTVSGSNGFAGVGPYVLHAAVAPTTAPADMTVLRDGSSLVVTWDAVPSDFAGGAITRYRVVATPTDGGEPIGCTASPDADGCTVGGIADGVDYAVTVQVVNAVGFGPVGEAAPHGGIAANAPTTACAPRAAAHSECTRSGAKLNHAFSVTIPAWFITCSDTLRQPPSNSSYNADGYPDTIAAHGSRLSCASRRSWSASP